jgi:hypothetical protein
MPKSSKSSKASKGSAIKDVLTADPKSLDAAVDAAIAHVEAAKALFGQLYSYDDEARRHSTGRLREGESKAMRSLLDAADKRPELFVAVATRDHGEDDALFETAPARGDLARFDALSRLGEVLQPFTEQVADTKLRLGELARDVTMPAYAVGKAAAVGDPKFAPLMAKVVSFYGGASVKAAKTKAKKKKGQKTS